MAFERDRVFIVHGYQGWPQKNWFPWLREKCAEIGVQSVAVAMPRPDAPVFLDWMRALQETVAVVDSHTYFVAHSLGCITVLQYLMRARVIGGAGGIVLVSGFDRPIAGLPQLDGFVKDPLDYHKLIAQVPHRAILSARDDSIVPFTVTEQLARKLKADFYPRDKGNHFMDTDGFLSLPLVFSLLQRFMREEPAVTK